MIDIEVDPITTRPKRIEQLSILGFRFIIARDDGSQDPPSRFGRCIDFHFPGTFRITASPVGCNRFFGPHAMPIRKPSLSSVKP